MPADRRAAKTGARGGNLDFLLRGVTKTERTARLRELRAVAMLLCGANHPATRALECAISDPRAAGTALASIDTLPALRRRRVLAIIAALLPSQRHAAR
jgi:hypothetical protein